MHIEREYNANFSDNRKRIREILLVLKQVNFISKVKFMFITSKRRLLTAFVCYRQLPW